MRLKAEQKLEFKSQLLSALALCTEKFLLSKTTQEMFQETYNIIGKVAKTDHIYYYEKDFDTDTISQKYKWSREETREQNSPKQHFTESDLKEIIEKAQNKKILNILTRQLDEDSYFKNLLILNDIKSILILPLYIHDVFTGFIAFDDCKNERRWSEEEIYIFQTLANNISSALERNRNQTKIIESEEKFKLIANNIPGTVYLSKFDAFSTKIFLNDEILNLTGYSKSEFLKPIFPFYPLFILMTKTKSLITNLKIYKTEKHCITLTGLKEKQANIFGLKNSGMLLKKEMKLSL